MSNNLRDRIVATVSWHRIYHRGDRAGWGCSCYKWQGSSAEHDLHVADAVILELETGLSFSERMTLWALLRPDCIITGEIEINTANDE